MSWKLFFQIVLLILIAGVVLAASKNIGYGHDKYGHKGMMKCYGSGMMEMQKGSCMPMK